MPISMPVENPLRQDLARLMSVVRTTSQRANTPNQKRFPNDMMRTQTNPWTDAIVRWFNARPASPSGKSGLEIPWREAQPVAVARVAEWQTRQT
jgi:hypothetical protein